jgi:hypothetical protein
MPDTIRPKPEAILAHVRLLRVTDRLLDVANELREAREKLQALLNHPDAAVADSRGEAANVR